MRRHRILQQGAWYHVSARANGQAFIFSTPVAKKLFETVLVRARKKYSFQIANFCIMSNHVHFLIRPGDEASLSRILQWILGVFAINYNRRFGANGHVWGERFFSRIIEGLVDFLRTCVYIDSNPVAEALAIAPGQWPFCGLSHHRRGEWSIVDPPLPVMTDVLNSWR